MLLYHPKSQAFQSVKLNMGSVVLDPLVGQYDLTSFCTLEQAENCFYPRTPHSCMLVFDAIAVPHCPLPVTAQCQ